jgi:hypothetical protein
MPRTLALDLAVFKRRKKSSGSKGAELFHNPLRIQADSLNGSDDRAAGNACDSKLELLLKVATVRAAAILVCTTANKASVARI